MQYGVDNQRRRAALGAALVLGLAAMLPLTLNRAASPEERRLSFFHTHTGESLDIVYARDGRYITPALDRINEFLSDFRTGDVTVVDPGLLDILYEVRESLRSDETLEVISAYRSPATNAMLRSQSTGVAQDSQHLLGKAIDVRLRGTATSRLRDAAIAIERGGVGYYPESDFVHIDTGRVRQW
jgi:uncharacterized protein YcbK (DUF882 family)